MSDQKNIDRLFQEKFKDFEATPSDAVWERIEGELHGNKKKRRIIPIWWRVAGIAALLALIFTVGYNTLDITSEEDMLPVVGTEEQSDQKNNETIKPADHTQPTTNSKAIELVGDPLNKESIGNQHDAEQGSNDKSQTGIATTTNDETNDSDNGTNGNPSFNTATKANTLGSDKIRTVIAEHHNKQKRENNSTDGIKTRSEIHDVLSADKQNGESSLALTSKAKYLHTTKIDAVALDVMAMIDTLEKAQSIEDAIAENENINEKEEDKKNRWSIAPNVAPVYFSSLGEGSPIHSQFNQNTKSGELNMSYGINGGYAINDRLKVRAGIHRVDLSYSTNDVLVFAGADTQARGTSSGIGNIDFTGGVQSLSFISSPTLSFASVPELLNTKIEGNLDQRFGFIEVPLELEYRLIDKKLGINVIGGFSTFFLSDNEIYADIDGNSTLIGEANNINSTSYSANFGIGIDYSITKRLNVNLEPMFKYQINTFNNSFGDFQPFFIGVYTGLSFKF